MMSMQAPDNRQELLLKVLVIGDIATGKTSIIRRYVNNVFTDQYRSTIGVDFALKILNWDSNTIIRLQLWDIAGQERFSSMTRVYYKEAAGALIVFDATRTQTFDAVAKWKADLDSKVQLIDDRPVPIVLLANKSDLPDKVGPAANATEMDDYCNKNGFVGWFQTSAKEDVGIQDAIKFLIENILAVHRAGRFEQPVLQIDNQARKLTNGSSSRSTRNGRAMNEDDSKLLSKCC